MSNATTATAIERKRLLRHVLVPVVLLIVFASAAVALLVHRAGVALDEEAASGQRQSVRSVMNRLPDRLSGFASDYALWDEFYIHARDRDYDAWSEANLGPYMGETFGVTEAWIVSETGDISYGWTDGEVEAADAYASNPDLAGLVARARAKNRADASTYPVSGFILHQGSLHAAVAVVIKPHTAELLSAPGRVTNIFVALADMRTAGYDEIEQDFRLGDLSFRTSEADAAATSLPIDAFDGRRIGYLQWTAAASSAGAFLNDQWRAGATLLIAIALVLGMLSLRWRRTIDRLQKVTLAAEAAEDASRAKSAFIANMSHELRTPLNAIIGFSEIMTNESFGPHAVARYKDYSADILSSGRHLLAVINDVLSLARIEAQQFQFQLEPVAVDEVAETAVRMLSGEAARRSISLTYTSRDSSATVIADPTALTQILINLIGNAIKFTNAGGVVRITWAVKWLDGTVEISVTDNGIGIAEDQLPLIGTPFFQVADVLARNTGGMGLGLSIVDGMARAMSGSMTIESEEGRGTTVRVRLPVADRDGTRLIA